MQKQRGLDSRKTLPAGAVAAAVDSSSCELFNHWNPYRALHSRSALILAMGMMATTAHRAGPHSTPSTSMVTPLDLAQSLADVPFSLGHVGGMSRVSEMRRPQGLLGGASGDGWKPGDPFYVPSLQQH